MPGSCGLQRGAVRCASGPPCRPLPGAPAGRSGHLRCARPCRPLRPPSLLRLAAAAAACSGAALPAWAPGPAARWPWLGPPPLPGGRSGGRLACRRGGCARRPGPGAPPGAPAAAGAGPVPRRARLAGVLGPRRGRPGGSRCAPLRAPCGGGRPWAAPRSPASRPRRPGPPSPGPCRAAPLSGCAAGAPPAPGALVAALRAAPLVAPAPGALGLLGGAAVLVPGAGGLGHLRAAASRVYRLRRRLRRP